MYNMRACSALMEGCGIVGVVPEGIGPHMVETNISWRALKKERKRCCFKVGWGIVGVVPAGTGPLVKSSGASPRHMPGTLRLFKACVAGNALAALLVVAVAAPLVFRTEVPPRKGTPTTHALLPYLLLLVGWWLVG